MKKEPDWDFETKEKRFGRSFIMRALVVVGAIHVAGLSAFLMVQGCATNNSQGGWKDIHTMPKSVDAPPSPYMPPAVQHSAPQRAAMVSSPKIHVANLPTAAATYKVQKGETLSVIASRYGISWKTLAAMNGMDDPNKLRVGQTLSVPSKSTSSTSKATTSHSTPVKALPAGATYTVQSGDTLSAIASRNKIKIADLKAANGLTGDRIMVKQKLVIPGVSSPVQPKKAAPTPAPAMAPTPATPAPAQPALPMPVAPAMATPDNGVDQASVEPAAPVNIRVKSIIVYSGDTLDSIAAQHYTSVKKINELNKFAGPVQLIPGQRIYVPLSE
jgi:LysM repeat protein